MQSTSTNAANANEPAICINGSLYVITDSAQAGSSTWKQLVGPMGGSYLMTVKSNGKRELMSFPGMRSIWREE